MVGKNLVYMNIIKLKIVQKNKKKMILLIILEQSQNLHLQLCYRHRRRNLQFEKNAIEG